MRLQLFDAWRAGQAGTVKRAFRPGARRPLCVRRLILRNGYSPGDIVMLTAAVRDLHRGYPGQFITDVRTPCAELWEHNPHITPLREDEPGVEVIECTYPLIDQANQLPHHCLQGFIDFLNRRLGLAIALTEYRGDIHLSAQEKAWYSQVRELTRSDIPFWIIAAGGKYDVTIKWWSSGRYQEVIDHFRDRIQFVQVGQAGHHHPKLDGVIDLRGETSLRELVRLVYHAQGVLCSVTALMHLAAAVEVKNGGTRACVVVAGGREPPHWEAYPGHQFIHTVGALDCCRAGGCWKDRVRPLGDGDPRDRRANRCVDVVQDLPRCMHLIRPAEVARRIEYYFKGGSLKYLGVAERRAARRAIAATRTNAFEAQRLSLQSAREACDRFLANLPAAPKYSGRGVVVCGGGVRFFANAWVGINRLRDSGCELPIQLWHLGAAEVDERMKRLIAPLDVECVDAYRVRRRYPVRLLGGWPLKAFALVYCPFAEVLLLDADNVAVRDPEYLFRSREYLETGAVFWPDYQRNRRGAAVWRCLGLRRPREPEFESGQVLVNKRWTWGALRLALWMNENADFFYQHIHGDKETFHLAFRRTGTPYRMIPHPIRTLPGTMCQHDFGGRRLFQHRNTDKWDLFLSNLQVPGFRFEAECRRHLRRLRRRWDGRIGAVHGRQPYVRRAVAGRRITFFACMISCAEREAVREITLKNLGQTDWDVAPLVICRNGAGEYEDCRVRQRQTAYQALQRAARSRADYVLFLEDDLEFNLHLRRNLLSWAPLKRHRITLAGLYNPGLPVLARDPARRAVVIAPHAVFGSQAFLLSAATVKYLVKHWNSVDGMQDIRMSRLAGQMGWPLFYHAPSLVQHTGRVSVWGGPFHQAADFDRGWSDEPVRLGASGRGKPLPTIR
jgi:ADP-heptose:LPS heptosyltransferase